MVFHFLIDLTVIQATTGGDAHLCTGCLRNKPLSVVNLFGIVKCSHPINVFTEDLC